MNQTTLVMGAGGPWGVAWMTGVLLGLEERGIDVRHPRAMIGSSAGAILGARLGAVASMQALFEWETSVERQMRQATQFRELVTPKPGAPSSMSSYLSILSRSWEDETERIKAICELAAAAKTASFEDFDKFGRPPETRSSRWPSIPFRITAIDVDRRALHTFEASSGVDMTLAVLASCAIPAILPPVPIADRLYIDGGCWGSGDNAHLAAGAPSVLVMSALAAQPRSDRSAILKRDLANLQSEGARVHLIAADAASFATRGNGAPDPTSLKAAAEAGRAQGHTEVIGVRAIAQTNAALT
jgi:NTE family protein